MYAATPRVISARARGHLHITRTSASAQVCALVPGLALGGEAHEEPRHRRREADELPQAARPEDGGELRAALVSVKWDGDDSGGRWVRRAVAVRHN